MITIRDVAKAAGVSVATVSAVLNNDSKVKVSEKLTKKVKQAMKELNYRPNLIARNLAKNESRVIAYIVPSISNPFFSQIARTIEDMAFSEKYSIYLCNTGGREERARLYIENLIDSRVSGVITTLTWEVKAEYIKMLREEKIPVVGLAGAQIIKDIDTVTVNDREGGRIATEYLIRKGHKNIGFIGLKHSETTKQRYQGYLQAFKNHELPAPKDLVVLGTEFTREEGANLTEVLLRQHPEVTGIFVYNDELGAGVIDKLWELKIKIPQETAVIGFDDSVAGYTRPRLTTMILPKEEMARTAMEMLFERIRKKEKKLAPRHVQVLPTLMPRESA